MRSIEEIDAEISALISKAGNDRRNIGERYFELAREKIKAEYGHPGPWTEIEEKCQKKPKK